ncbi:Phosphoethanolamine N-methyltransferase 1 [Cladorrhinum samala]|uniref:Phosphoethanolamine N-methyltransferase 1 n=1 Tax=Cladorrhinum samala TaxID=585594 RepID=A0AAV9HBE2_9PEZI|nr:Phosphoethanolamine N-methyltransferase 1 [Cladorrhinum samala]
MSKSPSPPPPTGVTTAVEGDVQIDVDEEGFDDDSTYGSLASSSESLASSILKFRQENGRKYHAYKPERGYILPSDELESDRLDLQHHIFLLSFDSALHICPAGKDGKPLKRVLDAGTGTGIWAVDFADEHPETHVIGVDLSPIQPDFVPPNVAFYVDDLEEDWTYTEPFDFIYGRMLTGALTNWPKFFERAFQNLSPGGWLELDDITFPALSDDGTLKPDSALSQWNNHCIKAGHMIGHSIESAKEYKRQMVEAGFVNVHEKLYKWPINSWARDAKFKEIGMWNEENFCGGIYGLSVALFTRALGWTKEELEVFLVDVRKDLRNKHIHAYWPIWVVYGQKPE